ncbi:MAG: FISUMP domain-containing protein [Bacteroidales bacterium]|nr:FISUMP domain-containing protein [Bacteroidales bacterium]
MRFLRFLLVILIARTNVAINAQSFDSIIDLRNNKTYKTVEIGQQVWMAENLNFRTAVGSWCYDNQEENCTKYGRMYNWHAAKIACPEGWRLPTKSEIEILFSQTGGNSTLTFNALTEGGNSGFSALSGGWRGTFGSYNHKEIIGYWWTSSTHTEENAWFMGMSIFGPEAFNTYGNRKWSLSVRCIKES